MEDQLNLIGWQLNSPYVQYKLNQLPKYEDLTPEQKRQEDIGSINDYAAAYPEKVLSDEFAQQRKYITEETWSKVYDKLGLTENQLLQSKKIPDHIKSKIVNKSIRQTTDDVGKKISLGMLAATTGGYLIPATMSGWAAFSAAHPMIAAGVDAGLTAHGVANLFGENGVQKTYNHFKNGEIGAGLASGAVDALDLMGGTSLLSKIKNIANPVYRASHAKKTITPAGYSNPLERGYYYIKSLLTNQPGELSVVTAPAYGEVKAAAGYIKPYVGHDLQAAQDIAVKTRQDAFDIYLGLKPKNGMYVQNPDGTFSYNMGEVYDLSHGKFTPNTKTSTPGHPHGVDYVTGAGGGLTGNTVKRFSDNGIKYGVQTITDRWDLHPFRNTKLFKDIINQKLSKIFNNESLVPFFQKLTDNKFTNWIDNKVSEFEVGPIIGGKPFEMKTEIPFVWDKQKAKEVLDISKIKK